MTTPQVRFAVTTSRAPRPRDVEAARASADHWRAPFVERGGQAVADVARGASVAAVLVLSPDRAALWLDGHLAVWDAGMGALRLKRLRTGERATRDGFLEAAQLRAGDAVLDCSLGLGADALVAAEAVGPAGRVVALEASAPLAALTAEGLRRCPDPAAPRISVQHAHAAAWLPCSADGAFDVVVFDPMFRRARAQPPGFDLVRQLADARPLASETLCEATRVARRSVLVKDGAPGWDLLRLGLTPLPASRWADRVYGRIDNPARQPAP